VVFPLDNTTFSDYLLDSRTDVLLTITKEVKMRRNEIM